MSADRTTDLTAAAPSTFIPVATARHGLLPQRQSALSPRWRATGPARAVWAAIPSCRPIEARPCFGDREPLSASIRAVGSQSSIVPSVIGNRSLQYHPLPVPCSRPHTVIEYILRFHLKITSDIHWISDTNRRDSDPIDGSSLLGSSRAEQYPAPVDAALGRGSDDFNKPLVCSIIGSG